MPNFLITSCGCSGSHYTANLLNELGKAATHEQGILFENINDAMPDIDIFIGWKWIAIDFDTFPFKHIFHQVRHPLDTIQSSLTHIDIVFTRIENYVGRPNKALTQELESRIFHAAYCWYKLNQACEKISSWTYKVENLKEGTPTFESFCQKFNISEQDKKHLRWPASNTHTRKESPKYQKNPKVTLESIKNIDATLANNICEIADRYEYSL